MNSCHRLPPKVALGSAGAISEPDLTDESLKEAAAELNEEELRQLLADCREVGMTSVAGAGADVSDAFHQFAVDEVADWFGLDDPMPAGYWGVDSVYENPSCPSSPVRSEELLYPVLRTMCMGWSWALYFCLSATEFHLSRCFPSGLEMSVREKHPAPAVTAREPVTAAYVDNANLIAFPPNAARRHHATMAASFLEVGLTTHEFVTDATDHETLGLVAHGRERRVRHKPQRVWRFHLASLAPTPGTCSRRRATGVARSRRASADAATTWSFAPVEGLSCSLLVNVKIDEDVCGRR